MAIAASRSSAGAMEGARISCSCMLRQLSFPASRAPLESRISPLGSDTAMIAGSIVGGNAPPRLLIRALGPSLPAAGVANALSDPRVEIRDSNGARLAGNDSWRSTQEQEILATSIAPADDR